LRTSRHGRLCGTFTRRACAHSARHFGIEQYAALNFLGALGATVLKRVLDDWVVGWPTRKG
jgi:hypothetical protein